MAGSLSVWLRSGRRSSRRKSTSNQDAYIPFAAIYGVLQFRMKREQLCRNNPLSNIEKLLIEKCLGGILETTWSSTNFLGMNFIAVLLADIIDDQLAILFNLSFIEDLASILWHQQDVVGNLAIAMAKTGQFQCISHPSHSWVAPPMAKVPNKIFF